MLQCEMFFLELYEGKAGVNLRWFLKLKKLKAWQIGFKYACLKEKSRFFEMIGFRNFPKFVPFMRTIL